MVWLFTWLLATAWAQPQTTFCGQTISSLDQAITAYNRTNQGAVHTTPAFWLRGTWKRTEQVFFQDVILPIPGQQAFAIDRQPVKVCPQEGRSFYVYSVNSPSQYATVTFKNPQRLELSHTNGDARLQQIEGSYIKLTN